MSDVNEIRIRRQIAQRLSLRGPQEVAAMKAELANQRAAFQRWAEGERGRVTGHVTDAMSRRQVRQR